MSQGQLVESSLHRAAAKGDLETVQTLLVNAQGNPNVRNSLGQTLLHWAAGGGHGDVAAALLRLGVDPNARDNGGLTPLHWVASEGHGEVANILVGAGADPSPRDNDGLTPLHWAASGGHGEVVNILVGAGADPQANGYAGQSTQHVAVLQSPLMTWSRQEANQVKTGVDSHATALVSKTAPVKSHKALIAEATCNLLREDKNNKAAILVSGYSLAKELLCRAVFAGNIDLVKALVQQETPYKDRESIRLSYVLDKYPNFRKPIGSYVEKYEVISTSPLHCAALGGHVDVVSFLIKEHTLDLDQQALLGRKGYVTYSIGTPLHLAVIQGHIDIINVLIQAGANINSKNSSGKTPLHLAVIQGHIDVINVLIQAGANINSKNSSGKTPLHLAFEQCNEEAISILIEAGADPNLVF